MSDEIRLVLPADPRYLDVAVAAIETLADRAGIDADDLAAMRALVHEALGERVSHRGSDVVVLCYEVGDGFLGVRLDSGDTSYAHT
jgi:anti-sigma regulatory factor (Ser/Thr protein kinase)